MKSVMSRTAKAALGTWVITLGGRPAANYVKGLPSKEEADKEASHYYGYEWARRPIEVVQVTRENWPDLLASCAESDTCGVW